MYDLALHRPTSAEPIRRPTVRCWTAADLSKQGGSSRSPGYIHITLGLCQLTPSDLIIKQQTDEHWTAAGDRDNDALMSLRRCSSILIKTCPSNVIWEERVALARLPNKVPIGYNGTPQTHPQICPLSSRRSPPSTISPVPRPTPLTTSNGIWIQSTVLPQYTFWTDRQTHGISDRFIPRALTLYYIDSERRAKNSCIVRCI